jgi:hypothetical protein
MAGARHAPGQKFLGRDFDDGCVLLVGDDVPVVFGLEKGAELSFQPADDFRLSVDDDRVVGIGMGEDDGGVVTDVSDLDGRWDRDDIGPRVGPDMPDGSGMGTAVRPHGGEPAAVGICEALEDFGKRCLGHAAFFSLFNISLLHFLCSSMKYAVQLCVEEFNTELHEGKREIHRDSYEYDASWLSAEDSIGGHTRF